MKTIAITGISGFVGTNLKKAFNSLGYNVIGISRENIKNSTSLISIIEQANIVINLAGANIVARWSMEYKQELVTSRIDTTKALVNAMANASKKPELFISTSAIGVYKTDKCYDEKSKVYEDDFLANLCKDWELEASRAKSLNIRVAIFRFGIVLGDGGALKKMLLPFKLGLGGIIGNGKQYFSYIHIKDLINAYKFLIDNDKLNGVFNLTAPSSTTNYGLTKALGKALHRPTIFPLPNFVLELIFGEGSKVLTSGQCVAPNELLKNGFIFEFKDIDETIKDLV